MTMVKNGKGSTAVAYPKVALDFIEKKIALLEALLKADDISEHFFRGALEEFKRQIKDLAKVPKDLAQEFISINYDTFANRQKYVNALRQKLETCCRKEQTESLSQDAFQQGMNILRAASGLQQGVGRSQFKEKY